MHPQGKIKSALYAKAMIEDALVEAKGGIDIILKGTSTNRVLLVAIGLWLQYRKNTLILISTGNA